MVEIEEDLSYLFGRVCRARRNAMAERLRPVGLHCGQDTALMHLNEEADLRQVELAERLGVEPPTVSRTVRRLERDGLVERRSDPEDARAMRLHLTGEGRRMRRRALECWRAHHEQCFEGLSPEEQMLLRRLLLQMFSNLT